jgi:hypothetical protein
MYYIAKRKDYKNTYAVGDRNPSNRDINNAFHFDEETYQRKRMLYQAIGYIFIKILDDGTKIQI